LPKCSSPGEKEKRPQLQRREKDALYVWTRPWEGIQALLRDERGEGPYSRKGKSPGSCQKGGGFVFGQDGKKQRDLETAAHQTKIGGGRARHIIS